MGILEIEMEKRKVYTLKKENTLEKSTTINLVHFNFCDFLACNIALHNTHTYIYRTYKWIPSFSRSR